MLTTFLLVWCNPPHWSGAFPMHWCTLHTRYWVHYHQFCAISIIGLVLSPCTDVPYILSVDYTLTGPVHALIHLTDLGRVFETLTWNMFQLWSSVERFRYFGYAGVTSLFRPKPNQGRESVTERISRWRKSKHRHDQGAKYVCRPSNAYILINK